MRENIYAFTEVESISYPGYVSINEIETDKIEITVRSPGNKGINQATLMISEKELLEMARAIQNRHERNKVKMY